jgi:hypothetical protein
MTTPSSVPWRITGLALVGSITSCATASAPPPPLVAAPAATAQPAPALSKEMAKLAFYVGRWSCQGTEFAPGGAETATEQLSIEVTPVLDGSWLSVIVSKDGHPITRELKGYDSRDHKFHHLWTYAGGIWGSLTSDGWNGTQLVFTEDHPAAAGGDRMTFQYLDDQHFAHRAESSVNGSWQLAYDKKCSKLP